MARAKSGDEPVGVADLKRRFSEYLDRVVHDRARVVVERRGKRVAALVPVDEIDERPRGLGRGLAAAAGAWEHHRDVDEFLRAATRSRRRAKDRAVPRLR